MLLSRQEKEKLVLDLYNEGKNTRQIAQAVAADEPRTRAK
jgi:hypothetical protein